MSDDEVGGTGLSGPTALPRSGLQKLIREAVPSELRVASELTDMIIECCTEFVEMVSSSANEVSTQDKKTTINPEHVLKALEDLGFVDLQKNVNTYWQQWKESSKGIQRMGSKKTAADQAGMSEEDQIQLQKQMFAEAKARAAGQIL